MKMVLAMILLCAACSNFEKYAEACRKSCEPNGSAAFVNSNPEVCVCK